MTNTVNEKVKNLLYQIENVVQTVSEELETLAIDDHCDVDVPDDDMEEVEDYKYRVEDILSQMQDMTAEFLNDDDK